MPEFVFKVVGLVLAVIQMTVRSVYERKLGRPAKLAQLKQAPPDDRRELLVVSYGTIVMWLYFLSPWLDFATLGFPEWLRWTGAVLTAFGIGLFVWTHAALAGNWSPFVQVPPAGTLITSGPYRLIRHPMYAAFFIYNAGLFLLISNWIAGIPALIAFAWMYLHRVRREERVMLETFGEEYRAYAEKTGRLVPGLRTTQVG